MFSFTLPSFAAEAITYRLCTFSLTGDSDKPNTFLPVSDNGQTVTQVKYNTATDVRVTAYQQTNKLKIGSSYTLTYGVKNLSAVGSCNVFIFLSDSLTNFDNAVQITEFSSSSCSLSYYNNFSIQFTYPEQFSGKNTYIVVLITTTKGACGFNVTDFYFTNNDKSEEKIDGVLEWLSAVYHGIVGGEDSRGVQHDGLVQGIKNGLSGLGDRISSFFDSLKEKLTAIGYDIKAKFQEIADKFTEFFDKFKPRVYEEFLWQRGNIANDGSITTMPVAAYTSEIFYVSSGSKYLIDVLPTVDDYHVRFFRIIKYDVNGQFLDFVQYTDLDSEFSLESGFNYRFVLIFTKSIANLNSFDLSKLCNSFVKIYCDEGWVNALIHALLNGIKQLFIPGPGYFQSRFEDVKTWAAEHFGIVYTAGDLGITVLRQFTTLTPPADPVLNVPAWQMRLPFDDNKVITLVEESQIHFNDYIKEGTPLHSFYKFYKVFITVAIIFMVVNYARNKFDYVFGKDGEGVS